MAFEDTIKKLENTKMVPDLTTHNYIKMYTRQPTSTPSKNNTNEKRKKKQIEKFIIKMYFCFIEPPTPRKKNHSWIWGG